jgi:hypothetical protein
MGDLPGGITAPHEGMPVSPGEPRPVVIDIMDIRPWLPGFDLERGGRLGGAYDRPPFTGYGWMTPLVNLVAAGSGNAVFIDLLPLGGGQAGLRIAARCPAASPAQ